MTNSPKTLIGRIEQITMLDFGNQLVPAKVDTGADRSSIWASKISENDGKLTFVLFDKKSAYYTGQVMAFPATKFMQIVIENSFGKKEKRYLVKLRIKLAGRLVRASFTLADRSVKTYPILLGCRLLAGKYIVDVSIPPKNYFPASSLALFVQNPIKSSNRIHRYADKIWRGSASKIIKTGNRKPISGGYSGKPLKDLERKYSTERQAILEKARKAL